MSNTTSTGADEQNLGASLTDLSNSADGLSERVRSLNRAVDDLQDSTERWGERQQEASEELSRAADSLRAGSTGQPSTAGNASTGFAPADD